MARPTDYNAELLEKSKDYLKNHNKYGDAVPSVAGLAKHLEIARSTVYDWNSHEDKKEFSDILENILSTQENLLISKGLTSDFNSAIVKLMLGKHGYHDKQEVDQKIEGTVSLTDLFDKSKETKEDE